ncbi:FERM domain-containing protein 8 isoform X3 [Strongylocentrotus purpuratus]|uniref:FERM domain-containing protein 8 n=1 Tax=Strongylocentrotus purpuratus TaxID=7668 RepID=A0A7M7HNC4_STRPU|nr:FERM domain-containing protein 8 isoform X3 [Strongylocentrotus purpuratus]|eukprot:XP_011675388.1 PREDICTED: FERM domain-containing protein 8 isoform X3 [Strongylocentrotus purpuratus]
MPSSEDVPMRLVGRRKNQNGSQGSRSPTGSPSGSPTHSAPHIQRMASTISNKSIKAMDVCIFQKGGSAHEIFVENALTTTAGTLFSQMMDCLTLPNEASEIFSLWLTSPLLELQLKPHHIPFRLCRQWPDLLDKYTTHSEEAKANDEPVVSFQRNAFYPKDSEKKVTNGKIKSRLFEEAKGNILNGMYPCEAEDYEYLGGLLAFLEYGEFNAEVHQMGFFKDNDLKKILPTCMFKGGSRWSIVKGRTGAMMSVEASILRHWSHFSEQNTSRQEYHHLFLEFCWKLPFYGSVFFRGQIEKTGRLSVKVRDSADRKAFVGINRDGVFVIDQQKQELLLGLKYDELSWEFTEPARKEVDCLPCLWLEFDNRERGKWRSKVLQIFSRQAVMMNAFIEACVDELNKRDMENVIQRTDHTVMGGLLSSTFPRSKPHKAALDATAPVFGTLPTRDPKTGLCSKMDRLCLSTFSNTGELISMKPKVKRSFTFHSLFGR